MVKIYKQPFAHDGDTIAIPDASQPDGKMSNDDGWTPDYQLPKTDPNYKPVGRQEMNGVFKEVTEALGEVQVQGAASWSPDGAPYPANAQAYHNGKQWLALRPNSVEPAEGADWTELVGKQYIDAATDQPLTKDTTFYFRNNGNINNDGLTSTTSFPPTQAGLDLLSKYDARGFSITLDCTGAIFNTGITINNLNEPFSTWITFVNGEFKGRVTLDASFTNFLIFTNTKFYSLHRFNISRCDLVDTTFAGATNTEHGLYCVESGGFTRLSGTTTFNGEYANAIFVNRSKLHLSGGTIHFNNVIAATGLAATRNADVVLEGVTYTGELTGVK